MTLIKYSLVFFSFSEVGRRKHRYTTDNERSIREDDHKWDAAMLLVEHYS